MDYNNRRAFEVQFNDAKVNIALRQSAAVMEACGLSRIQVVMVIAILYKKLEDQAPSPELKAKAKEVFEAVQLL